MITALPSLALFSFPGADAYNILLTSRTFWEDIISVEHVLVFQLESFLVSDRCVLLLKHHALFESDGQYGRWEIYMKILLCGQDRSLVGI